MNGAAQRRRVAERSRRLAVVMVAVALMAGCSSPAPTVEPTVVADLPTAAASASPSPTLAATPTAPPATFALAVVTGIANPKPAIDLAELARLAAAGSLVVPCGVAIIEPTTLASAAPCVEADRIAAAIQARPSTIALLPPGLVEPATEVLPVGGHGPYGLFGADLFGDPAARALPYPITGQATGAPALDPAWIAYDPTEVWTIASVGGVCSDRGPAYQAITLGKGWDWDFNGGTARYRGKPFLNPSPPEGVSQELIVAPVETGHAGTVAKLISGADLSIADVECPIIASADWVPNLGRALTFSISEDVLPIWTKKLGIDLVYLAANHQSDKGVAGIKSSLRLLDKYGIKSSLRLLDKYGIKRTGLGLNLDQGLEPAYVERGGVKVGFVAWNDVPGVARADSDTAGVPWLTKANVLEGVRRARAGGAQVVICDPQWWGGAEYHSDLRNAQFTQLEWFDEAGCDDVIGAGTHLSGPMLLRPHASGDGIGLVMASEGNLVFGQSWWQQTQEGVIMTVAFRGTQLVNVRLYPYVMLLQARAALTNPEGDGHYVLDRVWKNSTVDYLP